MKIQNRDTFSSYHPLVNLVYFVLVLLFTMFVLHPAILLISLLAGISYAVQLKGWAGLGKSLWYLLCLGLFAIAVNAAFNHEGATILGYLPSGNPLTLESMLYGIAAAAMLAAAAVLSAALPLFGRYIGSRVTINDDEIALLNNIQEPEAQAMQS